MTKIAQNFWSSEALIEVLDFPTPFKIVEQFTRCNSLLIIPYDCDKNFEPCKHFGQFAHWAVVVGFILYII